MRMRLPAQILAKCSGCTRGTGRDVHPSSRSCPRVLSHFIFPSTPVPNHKTRIKLIICRSAANACRMCPSLLPGRHAPKFTVFAPAARVSNPASSRRALKKQSRCIDNYMAWYYDWPNVIVFCVLSPASHEIQQREPSPLPGCSVLDWSAFMAVISKTRP